MTEISGPQRLGEDHEYGSNVGGLVSPALTPVLAAAIGWEFALHVAPRCRSSPPPCGSASTPSPRGSLALA